eukprot:8237251-Pyramimonas_sp.AAC.1
MYVPCDPGQVRSHGSLLHIASLQSFLESTSRHVRFPTGNSGLCYAAYYDLLRLLPARDSPTMSDPSDFSPWLSQRRYGQAPTIKTIVPMGNQARDGEPPKVGTLHVNGIRDLWPCVPNLKHHEQWGIILVFTGRVLTRFSYRACPGGTLVSREVPKFTDIDKAVSL